MSTSRPGIALAEGLAVALWLGASMFFSVVIARAAFAVLPTRTLAGALVGRVLPVLFITGMLVGALLVALEWPTRGHRWGRLAAGVVMLASCAVAQWAVAPRIARLRAAIGGPLDALAADDPRRALFGRLHAISVGWLGLAIVAALVAVFLIWRALDMPRAGLPSR